MTQIDAVEMQPDKDPIVWLNMVAGWIRSAQYDEDAALAAIEHGKTAAVNMESDHFSVVQQLEQQVRKLREILLEYGLDHTGSKDGIVYSDCVGDDCCALCQKADAALKESETA